MAFMTPVMKNNYNIYKSNRDRRVSESSNDKASASSASSCGGTRRLHSSSRSANGPSLSKSPCSDFRVGSSSAHRSFGAVTSRPSAFHHGSQQHHHGVASRNSSGSSQSSMQSSAKSSSSSSPAKVSSTSSLSMFHSKLFDKLWRSRTPKPKDKSSSTTSSKDIARKRS